MSTRILDARLMGGKHTHKLPLYASAFESKYFRDNTTYTRITT